MIDTDEVVADRARLAELGRRAGMTALRIRRALGADVVPPKKPAKRSRWDGKTPPSVDQILDVFVGHMAQFAYQVTADDLKSHLIMRAFSGPRMVAVATCRAILGDQLGSLSELGRQFGRNHATIKHAIEEGAPQAIERDDRLRKVSRETCAHFRA